jgi:ribonuclease HII
MKDKVTFLRINMTDAAVVCITNKRKTPASVLATRYIDASGCEITKQSIIGVDEAGRGPLFGRVYTAAVILPAQPLSEEDKDSNFDFSLMKDSKKFHSEKKIQSVSEYIKTHPGVTWAITYEEADVIDRINIRRATLQSMRASIDAVMNKHAHSSKISDGSKIRSKLTSPSTYRNSEYMLLIDGNDFIPMGKFNQESGEMEYIPHVCVEGGDNTYACIAAASILAKVARDEYIEKLCDEYPVLDELYSLRGNKGYGAKKHLDGIREHGITQWHRRSYGICKTFE